MSAAKDQGAPAALKAIEEHELKCRGEKDEAHAAWTEAKRCLNYGDEVSEQTERRTHNRYVESLEHWDDATKKLAIFDKGVKSERREGEKILVSDAKEMFAQYDLSLRLALEAYIISISQQAALCDSPAAFHVVHASAMRATRDGAIEAAKRDGVIPEWIA